MGAMQHESIQVISYKDVSIMGNKPLAKARKKALELFPKESVSQIIGKGVNGIYSFFISPCGSKQGWPEAEVHNKALDKFQAYLDTFKYADGSTSMKYVRVSFGEQGLAVQTSAGHNVDHDPIELDQTDDEEYDPW